MASALLLFPGALLLPVAHGQNENRFRTFTSTDGKTIEAKADAVSGELLTIRMKDGRSFELPLSRLSKTDQKWVREWQEELAKEFVPRLRISLDGNLDESTEQSGFVYVQKLAPELEVTNLDENFELAEAKATLLLIVEDLEKEDTFRVLSKESFALSIPAGESVKLQGKEAETKYATIRAYGGKYAGYTVLIENAAGKLIASDGSRGWDKNPENARKAEEGAVVSEEWEDRD